MVNDAPSPVPDRGDLDPDRELLARVRAGDDAAFGELFSRHADAVRRFALRLVSDPVEADDLTAEAFFRVLQAIRRGSGPTEHVRTYLLTVARRVVWEWSERRRDVPVEDEELSRRVEPYADNAGPHAEQYLIGRAFRSLPERWRTVLWRVEVEGERPATVASHFGLTANAMSALARRAREGLRAAYLQAHLSDAETARHCRSVRPKLGAYTAGQVTGSELSRIRKHLAGCGSCRALHADLTDVCTGLRSYAGLLALPAAAALIGHQLAAAIPPVAAVTGASAAGGVTSLSAPAVVGKSVLLAGRVKLLLAAASVAAVGVIGLSVGPLTTGGPGLAVVRPDQNDRGQVLALCTPQASTDTSGRAATASSSSRGTVVAGSSADSPGPANQPVRAVPAHLPRQPAQQGDNSAPVQAGSPAEGSVATPQTDPQGGTALAPPDTTVQRDLSLTSTVPTSGPVTVLGRPTTTTSTSPTDAPVKVLAPTITSTTTPGSTTPTTTAPAKSIPPAPPSPGKPGRTT
ncbi:sigma-70 family RNA polymerase sigma factor [Solihabitans fulvus]|uniref:Sigma-70 family RNA polymerase sigma factor n=1 Tax=Solihabitans fulvus TaxID=1892852 RepID=A0A5B2XLA0_9PSEU|nr:sigma-70 family RNA polymerase sigma factor [Solihabitans fulvus]KAA2263689.1 sigma-70 family RNA polymerase sigma factor [Solihabitans fulvus]